MAKLTPKKFTLEEFPEQRDWIGSLFSGLNQFIQEAVQGFSNSLTVKDNLFQEIKEIKWVNKAQDYPLSFRTKFVVNPKGILPIYLLNNTTGSYSPLAPWVVWSYSDGQVFISDISGLTASNTYTIRLLVIYE